MRRGYPNEGNIYNHRKGAHVVTLCAYLCILVASSCGVVAQEKPSALDLIRLAKSGSPELARSVSQTFNATELQAGTATKGHLSSFFLAIEAPSKPVLVIDGVPTELHPLPETALWYSVAEVPRQGAIHSFYYIKEGKHIGGTTDLPVFGRWPIWNPAYPQEHSPSHCCTQARFTTGCRLRIGSTFLPSTIQKFRLH